MLYDQGSRPKVMRCHSIFQGCLLLIGRQDLLPKSLKDRKLSSGACNFAKSVSNVGLQWPLHGRIFYNILQYSK